MHFPWLEVWLLSAAGVTRVGAHCALQFSCGRHWTAWHANHTDGLGTLRTYRLNFCVKHCALYEKCVFLTHNCDSFVYPSAVWSICGDVAYEMSFIHRAWFETRFFSLLSWFPTSYNSTPSDRFLFVPCYDWPLGVAMYSFLWNGTVLYL
jgi:hypothetical protein